ncbi:hypothetical protein N1851_025939 [Merluccius polli]|uniref:Uncharacterized protein n=1 Tax=Merluccius polli TaxID=89951 RepID=A0AA47NVQ3_MERPO|nr:hypothetical protein N1851_025939 [Merluccius polli]
MIIDFRRKPYSVPPSLIDDQAVEVVHQYKYLGTIIDDKLTFDANTDAVCAKDHQRISFILLFIESVLTFSFICWFGSLTLKNRNQLGHIVKVCSKIAGLNLDELFLLFKSRPTKKAQSTHPLFAEYKLLPSARRYALPRCRTNRLKN